MNPTHPGILALIPAYNESVHVAETVLGARRFLPVLVVDDGSIDDSAQKAGQAGAIVLIQQPNQGKGAALKRGFRWALDEGFDAVITLDADGQHDPQEIPAFLQAYQEKSCDLIIGRRDFERIPLVRRVANTIGALSFSWAVGQKIFDNQSGYRLVSRRLMESALASEEQGFQFEVEMILIAVQKGYSIGWVPIRTIYADEHSHISPIRHAIGFFRMVFHARRAMQKSRLKPGRGI